MRKLDNPTGEFAIRVLDRHSTTFDEVIGKVQEDSKLATWWLLGAVQPGFRVRDISHLVDNTKIVEIQNHSSAHGAGARLPVSRALTHFHCLSFALAALLRATLSMRPTLAIIAGWGIPRITAKSSNPKVERTWSTALGTARCEPL